MATSSSEIQDRFKLYKFTKVFTLKVAQIVVQSRQGKKITPDFNPKLSENADVAPQWFNLSIPDEPTVNEETKHVLNGEVVDALTRILCIEISLHTTDGDEMVLELWTIKLVPGIELCSSSAVYYRMSVMLKSTLSISRIIPAYKLARDQHKASYKIYHKIYGGEPDYDLLGEKSKTIKVSELHAPIGTLLIEVVYRTKMTILPDDRHKIAMQNANNDIMVKSDHFNNSPKKSYDKKELDLSKPLTAGAFVDTLKMKKLHETLSQKLPPEPPMSWLLVEKEKMEKQMKTMALAERAKRREAAACRDEAGACGGEDGAWGGEASGSSAHAVSKAIEVPKAKNGDKYNALMDFPFADGSPISELANFYQDCLQARSLSEEWTDVMIGTATAGDSEALARQLKMYEDAVPEFDSMVASMFSNSEGSSDPS